MREIRRHRLQVPEVGTGDQRRPRDDLPHAADAQERVGLANREAAGWPLRDHAEHRRRSAYPHAQRQPPAPTRPGASQRAHGVTQTLNHPVIPDLLPPIPRRSGTSPRQPRHPTLQHRIRDARAASSGPLPASAPRNVSPHRLAVLPSERPGYASGQLVGPHFPSPEANPPSSRTAFRLHQPTIDAGSDESAKPPQLLRHDRAAESAQCEVLPRGPPSVSGRSGHVRRSVLAPSGGGAPCRVCPSASRRRVARARCLDNDSRGEADSPA